MKQTTRILVAGMFFTLPLVPLAGRWLSDNPADNPQGTPVRQKNARGYYQPTVEEGAFPRISIIQATSGTKNNGADESAVTVTWQDSAAKTAGSGVVGPFRFVVYRGRTPLSRDALLDGAEKLSVLAGGTLSYTDKPAEKTPWYYAVSILDAADNEYFKPEYDQTYTASGVTPGTKAVATTAPVGGGDPHVKDLAAIWQPGNRSVRLSWQYSTPFRPGLRIVGYRNLAIIDTTTLDKAQVIGTITPSTIHTTFVHQPDQAGRWYYAVTSFAPDGRENRVLAPGVNATTIAVDVPASETVRPTNVVTTPKEIVLTNYVFVTNTVERFQTNIVTVETPATQARPYPDIDARPLETDLEARPLPASIEHSVYQEIRTYLKREDRRNRDGIYQSIYSLRRLESLAAGQQLKDQCTLFIGRAYFTLGEFHTAFSVFSSLRDRLPEEARHWMRRSSERMR